MNDKVKFAYLKEHVVPKVRITIKKLPMNSEGYAKAKGMMKERYGDPSEVVNAHIQKYWPCKLLLVFESIRYITFITLYLGIFKHLRHLESWGMLQET